jgi:hypothetical protein
MLERFIRRRRAAPAPLRGAPAVHRQKTYSAQTGFVYQYFYEGWRESRLGGQAGNEHVFQVSSDRRGSFRLSVFLPRAAVDAWQRRHGQSLTATEQYAAVKMALFEAFDERTELGAGVEIDAEAIERYLAALGIVETD